MFRKITSLLIVILLLSEPAAFAAQKSKSTTHYNLASYHAGVEVPPIATLEHPDGSLEAKPWYFLENPFGINISISNNLEIGLDFILKKFSSLIFHGVIGVVITLGIIYFVVTGDTSSVFDRLKNEKISRSEFLKKAASLLLVSFFVLLPNQTKAYVSQFSDRLATLYSVYHFKTRIKMKKYTLENGTRSISRNAMERSVHGDVTWFKLNDYVNDFSDYDYLEITINGRQETIHFMNITNNYVKGKKFWSEVEYISISHTSGSPMIVFHYKDPEYQDRKIWINQGTYLTNIPRASSYNIDALSLSRRAFQAPLSRAVVNSLTQATSDSVGIASSAEQLYSLANTVLTQNGYSTSDFQLATSILKEIIFHEDIISQSTRTNAFHLLKSLLMGMIKQGSVTIPYSDPADVRQYKDLIWNSMTSPEFFRYIEYGNLIETFQSWINFFDAARTVYWNRNKDVRALNPRIENLKEALYDLYFVAPQLRKYTGKYLNSSDNPMALDINYWLGLSSKPGLTEVSELIFATTDHLTYSSQHLAAIEQGIANQFQYSFADQKIWQIIERTQQLQGEDNSEVVRARYNIEAPYGLTSVPHHAARSFFQYFNGRRNNNARDEESLYTPKRSAKGLKEYVLLKKIIQTARHLNNKTSATRNGVRLDPAFFISLLFNEGLDHELVTSPETFYDNAFHAQDGMSLHNFYVRQDNYQKKHQSYWHELIRMGYLNESEMRFGEDFWILQRQGTGNRDYKVQFKSMDKFLLAMGAVALYSQHKVRHHHLNGSFDQFRSQREKDYWTYVLIVRGPTAVNDEWAAYQRNPYDYYRSDLDDDAKRLSHRISSSAELMRQLWGTLLSGVAQLDIPMEERLSPTPMDLYKGSRSINATRYAQVGPGEFEMPYLHHYSQFLQSG